tara:strand:+ start:6378 stop:7178 length:801 start_codon:yes stop_codon:yes gene_type:complete
MKILYVTTFNQRLYDATGKNMIESFVRHKTEGDLLIAHEDDLDKVIPHHKKFIFHNLEEDELLDWWLKENEDIIPVAFGGKFEGEYSGVHKFNHRAAQWFRKIAALNRAMDIKCEYDAIVFLDSDIVINKHLSASKIEEIFDEHSMFYHLGPHRRESGTGIESGVIGFNLKTMGGVLLSIVINKFKSGEFKKYIRWDDGYVFRMVVEENPQVPTRDIVNVNENSVVEFGPFAQYLVHNKGVHWKSHGFPSMDGSKDPNFHGGCKKS